MRHPAGTYIFDNASAGLHFYQILKNLGVSSEEITRSTGIESDLNIVFRESVRQVVECIDDPMGQGIQLSFMRRLNSRCPDMLYLKNIACLHDPHKLAVFTEAIRNFGLNTYTVIDNHIEISSGFSYFMMQATPYRLVIRKVKEG